MKSLDETKPIREILEAFESETPDFDSLFKGELLGDAPLRQIFQPKLERFETEAPSFDQLFAGQISGQPSIRHQHLVPMWAAISAVAACFALLMLLPDKVEMNQSSLSLIEQTVKQHKVKIKSKTLVQDTLQTNILTEKLESPKAIGNIAIDNKKAQIREKLFAYEEVERECDSTSGQTLTKLEPSSRTNLAVKNERSIEEAYAEARIQKEKLKREKMVLGTNVNSANRLLSLLNTKSGTYPFSTTTNQYSSGYSSLEGSSSLLRTATVSKNAWVVPENLPSSIILSNYQAVYSLPVNFGLSVSIPLFSNLDIISGINYTYLHSTTSSSNSQSPYFELNQSLHYIGIPLKVSFNIFKTGHFGTYAALGGTVEKGLAGIQKCHVVNTDGEISNWNNSQKIYGLQLSLTGQLGLYYELNKIFNLYLEPGMSYFIPNDQPVSSRTEEPYNFNIGFGLRYKIQ